MKYLLDTNICVHFLRGKYEIDKTIKEKGLENCYISEITVLIYINNASDDPIAVSANDSAFFECTEIRCFTALELL